jgi:hypothetical protein
MGIGFEVDGLRKAIASYNSPRCVQYNTVTNWLLPLDKRGVVPSRALAPAHDLLGFPVVMGEL